MRYTLCVCMHACIINVCARLQVWVDFCQVQCRKALAAPPPQLGEEEPESFFDASDTAEGVEAAVLVPHVPPARLEDRVMACLLAIQHSSQESATLLRSLQETMDKMIGDIHAVRAAVLPARRGYGYGYAALGLVLAASSATAIIYLRQKQLRGSS